jgi:hypothetical protein
MRLEPSRWDESHSMGVGLNVVRFFGKAMRIHHLLEEQRALRLSEHEEEDDGEQAVALARSIVESMNVIKFVGKLKHRSHHDGKIGKMSLRTQISIVEEQLDEAEDSGDLHAIYAALHSARYLANHYSGEAQSVAARAQELEDTIRENDPELGKKIDLRHSLPVRVQIQRLW